MYSLIPFNRREGNVFRYMDDIERSFFNNSIAGKEQFRTDISDRGDNYLLEAELPGFDKNELNVEVNGDTITISASHSEEDSQKDEEGNYIRRERRYGTFSRSFNTEGIDVEGILADYNNGVLRLTLPKEKVEAPQNRKIAIGGGEEMKLDEGTKKAKVQKVSVGKGPKA